MVEVYHLAYDVARLLLFLKYISHCGYAVIERHCAHAQPPVLKRDFLTCRVEDVEPNVEILVAVEHGEYLR